MIFLRICKYQTGSLFCFLIVSHLMTISTCFQPLMSTCS